ncbi:MAG TPA: hypothetical protein VGF06_15450, partial [Terriglobales bacterium]
MRKWMRERLKRRKKPAETSGEPGPAPLQPAYFETEAPATLPQETEPEAATVREPEEPEEARQAAAPAATQRQASGGSRRRRRRGGRGRGRGSQQAALPAQQPQPATPPPPPRPASGASKGTVILAIGLPGSGKSSWFKRNNITPLSSDVLRSLLFDDPTEQRFQ